MKADNSSISEISGKLGYSLNLRLLIHFIGDIHQPLHCVTRITKDRPNGDFGGNSFKIKPINDITNLHALWDSVIIEYGQYFHGPLNSTIWNYITTQA